MRRFWLVRRVALTLVNPSMSFQPTLISSRLLLTAVFDPQHHTRGESEAGSTTQLMEHHVEHLGFLVTYE